MRILVDIDNTIADLLGGFLRDYNAMFGDTLTPDQVTDYDFARVVKPEAVYKMDDVFGRDGFFRGLEPFPGAVETVTGWMKEHEVIFVTAVKPSHVAAYGEKSRWLEEHFGVLKRNQLVFATQTRGLLRADLLVDDKPSNVKAFKKHNPEGKAFCIAYPYNQDLENIADVRAYGWQDPAAAWARFDEHVRTSMLDLVPAGKMCFAPLPSGGVCKNYDCAVHTALAVPGSFYPKPVWELLGQMINDATLDSVDAELAHMRYVVDNIGKEPMGKSFGPRSKYELLIQAINSVFDMVVKRDKLLADRSLMFHRSVIEQMLDQIYVVLKKHIKDEGVLQVIGRDLNKVNLQQKKTTRQITRGS